MFFKAHKISRKYSLFYRLAFDFLYDKIKKEAFFLCKKGFFLKQEDNT